MSKIMIGSLKRIIGTEKITPSKIKSFSEKLPPTAIFGRRSKISKFIKETGSTVNYKNLRPGDKIWLFGVAPQYGYSRVIFKDYKNSNSDKMITLYFTRDKDFEDYVDTNDKLMDYASINDVGKVAYNRGSKYDDIFFKSLKKDTDIPVG